MNIKKQDIVFVGLVGLIIYLAFRPKKAAAKALPTSSEPTGNMPDSYRLKEDFSERADSTMSKHSPYIKTMPNPTIINFFKKGDIIKGKRYDFGIRTAQVRQFGKDSISTTTKGQMPNFDSESWINVPESILEPLFELPSYLKPLPSNVETPKPSPAPIKNIETIAVNPKSQAPNTPNSYRLKQNYVTEVTSNPPFVTKYVVSFEKGQIIHAVKYGSSTGFLSTSMKGTVPKFSFGGESYVSVPENILEKA